MKHTLTVKNSLVDAEMFCQWANDNGHIAKLGDRDYVDGVYAGNFSNNTNEKKAFDTMNKLWDEFIHNN